MASGESKCLCVWLSHSFPPRQQLHSTLTAKGTNGAPVTSTTPPAQGEGPKPGPSEAFGQFLLKPVSRRPGDAIEELETINKEVQDQVGKRPSVDQCIEDLNEAYKDILELSTASSSSMSSIPHCSSSMLIPERIKAKLTVEPLPLKHGGSLRSGLESWAKFSTPAI